MKSKTRTISAIAVLLVGVTLPGPEPASAKPGLVVNQADTVLTERLDWALGRFSDVGLQLPPLDVTFHNSAHGCEGHTGLYRSIAGIADIEICMPTEHIVLHELAHAWVETILDDDRRSIWMDYWGLDTWNRQDVDWSRRGNEKAADAIAYALGRIPANPHDSLLEYLCGYPLLTGNPLPGAAAECSL